MVPTWLEIRSGVIRIEVFASGLQEAWSATCHLPSIGAPILRRFSVDSLLSCEQALKINSDRLSKTDLNFIIFL